MSRVLFTAAVLLLTAAVASAQPYANRQRPRGGSVEIGGSAAWIGGYDAGDRSAQETANSSTGAPPLTLFTTTSRVQSTVAVEGRLGVYLSPRLSVEGVFQYAKPSLQSRPAQDFENASPVTASTTVSSYVAGGSVLYHFRTGRLQPFVSGGGGYLRQLYDGNVLALTGTEIHGGGGIKYWFGGKVRHAGLRVDALASARSKTVGFEDTRRILPIVSAGLTYLF